MDVRNLMTLWNFLFVFYLVYADVIREDGYNNFEGQFSVVHKGRMLRVLMFFNNIQREVCALHCVRHLRCKTINYHPGKKDCELTEEDFNEINVDTITLGWYNYGTPTKINGGWSSWRNYTDCTKTCGIGTLEQWRYCDSPTPKYGGAHCKGEEKRTVECNVHEWKVVNIAINKTVNQSSTYNEWYVPRHAIDESASTESCTEDGINEWWEVNLGDACVIKDIHFMPYIWYGSYNQGLLFETRRNEGDSWTLCKYIGDVNVNLKRIYKFKCDEQSTNAQFLRIRVSKASYLRIKGLKIFGY